MKHYNDVVYDRTGEVNCIPGTFFREAGFGMSVGWPGAFTAFMGGVGEGRGECGGGRTTDGGGHVLLTLVSVEDADVDGVEEGVKWTLSRMG